jgi:hypothetical protein
MKATSAIVLFLVSCMIHSTKVANACLCNSEPTVTASLQSNNTKYVFRGFVKRHINVGSGDINEPKYYSVRVQRVYKGCTFKNATSIVVKTEGNSGLCGVDIPLRGDYVFSGGSVPMDPAVFKIAVKKTPQILSTEMVSVQSCDFNAPFKTLSSEDKTLVGNQPNKCQK